MVVAKSDIQKLQRSPEDQGTLTQPTATALKIEVSQGFKKAKSWPAAEELPQYFLKWQKLLRKMSRRRAMILTWQLCDPALALFLLAHCLALCFWLADFELFAFAFSSGSLVFLFLWLAWNWQKHQDVLKAAQDLDTQYSLKGRLVHFVLEVWQTKARRGANWDLEIPQDQYVVLAMREAASVNEKFISLPAFSLPPQAWRLSRFSLSGFFLAAVVASFSILPETATYQQSLTPSSTEAWLSADSILLIQDEIEALSQRLKSGTSRAFLAELKKIKEQLAAGNLRKSEIISHLSALEEAIQAGKPGTLREGNVIKSPLSQAVRATAAQVADFVAALKNLEQRLQRPVDSITKEEFEILRAELLSLDAQIKEVDSALKLRSSASTGGQRDSRRHAEILGRQKKQRILSRLDREVQNSLEQLQKLQGSEFLNRPTASAPSEMTDAEKQSLLEQVRAMKERLLVENQGAGTKKRQREFMKRAMGAQGMGGSGGRQEESAEGTQIPRPISAGAPRGDGQSAGPKPGEGHDGQVFSDQEEENDYKTQAKSAVGQANQSGPSESEIIQSAAQKGFTQPTYQKLYRQYHQVAEAVLDEQVPRSKQKEVKKYFELIRPR